MSTKLWGGRFSGALDPLMEEFNASIDFDRRFYAQDIAGSRAHTEMLAARGLISREDAGQIARGLDQVRREIEDGRFAFSRSLEDIHMNVESRLAELVGAYDEPREQEDDADVV